MLFFGKLHHSTTILPSCVGVRSGERTDMYCTCFCSSFKLQAAPGTFYTPHCSLLISSVNEFFGFGHVPYPPKLFALWLLDNGLSCFVNVVDTRAVRGQRPVPKNTMPSVPLQTDASHGTVLSRLASKQQAGQFIPLFSGLHLCLLPTHAYKHKDSRLLTLLP